jgi:hypothetical protein
MQAVQRNLVEDEKTLLGNNQNVLLVTSTETRERVDKSYHSAERSSPSDPVYALIVSFFGDGCF